MACLFLEFSEVMNIKSFNSLKIFCFLVFVVLEIYFEEIIKDLFKDLVLRMFIEVFFINIGNN